MTEQSKAVKEITAASLREFTTDVMNIWKSPSRIRQLFAPNLTDDEFKYFIGLGIQIAANPYKKEIFAIKFGTAPAQIIVAHDLYLRRAQEQANFAGIIGEAVFAGEKFYANPETGEVKHEIDYEKRYADPNTLPYGAYAVVKFNDGRLPLYRFVAFREYVKTIRDKNTGEIRPRENWATMPETMIKKVARSQALRHAYLGLFGGSYTNEEYNPEMAEYTEVDDGFDGLEKQIRGRATKPEPEILPEEDEAMPEEVQPEYPGWEGRAMKEVDDLFTVLKKRVAAMLPMLKKKLNLENDDDLLEYLKVDELSPFAVTPDHFKKIEKFLAQHKQPTKE